MYVFFFLYMLLLFFFGEMLWPHFQHIPPGLPVICSNNYLEFYGRELLRSSKRISNSSCYATSSQFLIAPLVNHIKSGSLPTVFVNYSKTISILYNASLSKQ